LGVLGLSTLARSGPIWDSEIYVRMAARGGLLSGGLAPFCYRILTPAIARALPASLATSFELINQISLWAAGVVVCGLLSARGLRRETALIGSCVVILSAFAKFVLWYRFGVDQLALLGIVAVAWALGTRRFALAALLATVAALGKESVLLLVPFAYGELRSLPRLRGRRFQVLLATLVLWSGAVTAVVVARALIPHTSGDGPVATAVSWASARLRSPRAYCELLLALPKTFGAIPLLVLIAGRRSWLALRKEPYAALTAGVFVLAGIFGASDYERVYFLAIPFVLIVWLPLLEECPPSLVQAALMVIAHVSLLDVFSPPDFMNLRRWFMTNAEWTDLAKYAAEVLFWGVVLKLSGLGRDKDRFSESAAPRL
jgi:hypothetical protein